MPIRIIKHYYYYLYYYHRYYFVKKFHSLRHHLNEVNKKYRHNEMFFEKIFEVRGKR